MVYAQAARRRGDDIRLMASLETIGCYRSEPDSQRYPPLFRFFYPTAATSSESYRTFAPGRPCGGLLPRFAPTPTSLCRLFRRSGSFPGWHGATTIHSGVTATPP